jgi:anthranilate/para-aminobenzoate synthase component I
MRLVPLALRRDPLDALGCLAVEPGAFLVQVPDPVRPLVLLGCRPTATLRVHADGTAVRSDGRAAPQEPLAAIEAFVAEGPVALPFPLGATIGFLTYELGNVIEPRGARPADPTLPLALLQRHDPMLVYDPARGQYTLVASDAIAARAPWLERLAGSPPPWEGPLAAAPLAPAWDRTAHAAAVARIHAWLAAGDVYQVNLTLPFTTALLAPPAVLLARLARTHPVSHGFYLDAGGTTLVANSPELFLRRRGARLETRPIKGTRPRGTGRHQDAALVAELAADAKERAEHVMIVDLERNDLGRVAVTGAVRVPELLRVESHPSLHHLVSTVEATLRPDVGLAALLRATFPGGSITGAPKIRAMEIIRTLEPGPRGAYTGAFGCFHARGDLELGLAIRTATVRDGSLRWHAGGGIVADSDAGREWDEAWLKTAALRRALGEAGAPGLEQCSSG